MPVRGHVITPASKEGFFSLSGTVLEVSMAAMIEAATTIGQIFNGKRKRDQHQERHQDCKQCCSTANNINKA